MSSHEEENEKLLISQRYLDDEEKQIATGGTELEIHLNNKKLSQLVDSRVEFIEVKYNSKLPIKKSKSSMKLLKNSTNSLKISANTLACPQVKRFTVKKRVIEPEFLLTNQERLASVAISKELIFNEHNQKYWRDTKHSPIFKYKSKTGNPYQLIPLENEFSQLRKKNCWSEKMISRDFQSKK